MWRGVAGWRVQKAWDEGKAFRVARRAGMGGAPSPTPALVIGAGVAGIGVALTSHALSADDVPVGWFFAGLAVAVLGAISITVGLREAAVVVSVWRVWRRAARGRPAQVVTGFALPQTRKVAGYRVRTVVVQVAGRPQFVRLAFARRDEAARLPAESVHMDLFDAPEVRGPARLRSHSGVLAWAFAVRFGDFVVVEETLLKAEDGWPDSDESGGRNSGWPGDSDGDGDGDGGE